MPCRICGQVSGHDLSCPMREFEEFQKSKERKEAIRIEESKQKEIPKIKVSFAEVEIARKKVAEATKTIEEAYAELDENIASETEENAKEIAEAYTKALTEINRLEKIAEKEIKLSVDKANQIIETEKQKLLNETVVAEKQLANYSTEARKFLSELQPLLNASEQNHTIFCFGKKEGSNWQFQFGTFPLEIEFSEFAKQLHDLMRKKV